MEIAWAGTLILVTIIFFTDLIWRKIYNAITIPAILAGILYHSIWGLGIKFTLIGFAFMFVIGVIGLTVNGWGGGDAKMLILAGAWLGWYTAALVMLIGGLIALIYFAFKLKKKAIKKVTDQLRRIWLTVFWQAKGAWKDFEGIPDGNDPMPEVVPYGSCLAVGAWLVMFLQNM